MWHADLFICWQSQQAGQEGKIEAQNNGEAGGFGGFRFAKSALHMIKNGTY
jgi:hypothetical protein